MEKETPLRRFDLVFFISMPIAYYLTYNFMDVVKRNMLTKDTYLLVTDWNYILFNSILLPAAIAYFDFFYVQKQEVIKNSLTYQNDSKNPLDILFNGIEIGLSVYSLKF